MDLKDESVKVEGTVWQIFHAALIVEAVLKDYGTELTITSAKDGKHKDGSRHYDGRAIDVRTWKIKGREVEAAAKIKAKLGKDYDVVVEGDHIHVEYDPKG